MKKRRRRRWGRWVICILLLLLLAIGVTAEYVRRSDLPRQLLLNIVAKETGLETEASAVRLSWTGPTVVEGLALRQPLENQPLAQARRIVVTHTPIWQIVATLGVSVDRIEIDEPVVTLREDRDGQWNLQETISRIIRRQTAKPDDKPAAQVTLPAVDVSQGELTLTNKHGKTTVVKPLTFAAKMNRGAWELSFQAGDVLQVDGAVDPGGSWKHEMALDFRNVNKIAGLWLDGDLPPSVLDGTWSGRVLDGAIRGELSLDDTSYGEIAITGRTKVLYRDGVIEVTPQGFQVTPKPWWNERVTLAAGKFRVTLDDQKLTATQLMVEAMKGKTRLDGQFDLAEQSGNLQASWSGIEGPQELSTKGSLDVQIKPLHPGHFAITAKTDAEGQATWGQWQTGLQVNVETESTGKTKALFTFDQLQWRKDQWQARLDGMTASFRLEDDRLSLVTLGGETAAALSGDGWIDLNSKAWQLKLKGDRLPVEMTGIPATQYVMEIAQEGEDISIRQLDLTSEQVQVSVVGAFRPSEEMPLRAEVKLKRDEIDIEPAQTAAMRIRDVAANLKVVGQLKPIDLDFEGDLNTMQITVGKKVEIQSMLRVDVKGYADEHAAAFETSQFRLFDGQAILKGRFPYDADASELGLDLKNVTLLSALQLFNVPAPLDGQLSCQIDLRMPRAADEHPSLFGDAQVDGISLAEYAVGDLTLDLSMSHGKLAVKNLKLAGPQDGQIVGSANLALDTLMADIKLDIQDWRVAPPQTELKAKLAGQINSTFEIKTKSAQGQFDLTNVLRVNGETAGQQTLRGRLLGQVLFIDELGGQFCAGQLEGHGAIPFDKPFESQFDLGWKGIDATKLTRVWPGLDGLAGQYSGSLKITRDLTVPKSHTLRADLSMESDGGQYRTIVFKGGEAQMAVEWPQSKAKPRFVLRESQWRVADGSVNVWGRVTPNDGQWFAYANVDIDRLDLRPISLLAGDESSAVAGRLSGELRGTQPLGDLRHAYADGRLTVVESDLARIPVISDIYNLMNIKLFEAEPSGTGEARLRLEGSRLRIRRMDYKNRGAHVRLSMQVEDLTAGADSAIDGVALGSARVLPKLPLIREIEDALGVLQTEVTSMRIRGQLKDPNVSSAPLTATLSVMGDILGIPEGEPAP